MNAYEEKIERRRERLEARAQRLTQEGNASIESGMQRLRSIPFGQPMMPDHYSYNRDRNFRRKAVGTVDRGCETLKEAEDVARRAEAVGTAGISSDDPDAITKLQAELAALEERQAAMKAENDAWRKAGNKAGRQPDGTWVDAPCPGYRLSNNSANMRRITARIAMLEASKKREDVTITVGEVTCRQNVEENRVQLKFPGKPDDATRAMLKSNGFRWSPMQGTWQRHLNNAGVRAARYILEQLKKASA